jgi:hypothetical protein
MNWQIEIRNSKIVARNVTSAKAGVHRVMDIRPSAPLWQALLWVSFRAVFDFRISVFDFRNER